MTALIALVIIIILVALIFFGIVSLLSMQAARKSAAPFFPTPSPAIREALRAAGLRPGETFYDLGVGTGRALLIAEREFGARAVGFEISIFFYLIAKINLFVHGSRSKILFKSFWDADLRDADVVFCFLAIRTMKKMEEKLKAELKPGARIIVYAFPLPSLQPEKTLTISAGWKIFLYSNYFVEK